MMKNTKTQQYNRYTSQDLVADAAFVIVLICAAFGLLDMVGSF
jgi:hypothetical protein